MRIGGVAKRNPKPDVQVALFSGSLRDLCHKAMALMRNCQRHFGNFTRLRQGSDSPVD